MYWPKGVALHCHTALFSSIGYTLTYADLELPNVHVNLSISTDYLANLTESTDLLFKEKHIQI